MTYVANSVHTKEFWRNLNNWLKPFTGCDRKPTVFECRVLTEGRENLAFSSNIVKQSYI
jgi:hypothetical protein